MRAPWMVVPILSLLAGGAGFAFPLSMGLGNNSGTREFHFCRLEVTPRRAPCAGAPDCLEFDSPGGTLRLDVHRTASLAEASEGTELLHDMFQYATRLSLVGDARLVAQLGSDRGDARLDVQGFWYPSGRRLLVIDVQRVAAP